MSVRLAGVFAHPDDDAYLMGGSLLLHPDEIAPTIIFATSGEAGPISDETLPTRATLGRVREGEQRAYLETIGFPDGRVEFLRHPDFYLPDVPFEKLVDDIRVVLEETRPQIVVTFGPDGLTSHHDHKRVGDAATEAFHRARSAVRGEDAFQRLYYAALARSDVDSFYAGVVAGRYDYGEEGRLFDITGVPDEHIAVRVDTRSIRDRKKAGILTHRTQFSEYERLPEPYRGVYLDTECFVQAYPVTNPAGQVRSDLLDDLTVGAIDHGRAEAN